MYMGSASREVAWTKNGSQLSWADAALPISIGGTQGANIYTGSMIIELAAGDYIGVIPRLATSSITWYGGHSAFWGYLIG